MNDNEVMLQYLESIDNKIDELKNDLAPRVVNVERWQSNIDGKITMFGLFCGMIGSAIAWLAGIIHKSS